MMFLPQLPYMPFGSLRQVMTYPTPEKFSQAAILAALERLQLGHRAPSLDDIARWDKELTFDEQQRVAFIRVLLHAPAWVIEDEAMSALDADARRAVQSIFENELAGAALVNIGRDDFHNGFYSRVYRLQSQSPRLDLPLRLADGAQDGSQMRNP